MAAQFSQTTRSLASDTPRLSIAVWFGAALLLGAWLVWFFAGSVTVYETSRRARLEVRQASYPVAAQVASRVVSAVLTIGADVKTGDVLVRLDDSSERLRLKEEQVHLAALPPQIASLEREIAAREREKATDLESAGDAREAARLRGREADAAAEFARDYERRLEQLSSQGLVSSVDAKRASTDTLKASASRDALTSDAGRIEREAQTHVSQHDAAIESLRHQVTSLEGDIASAKATIERLQADIEKHLIRAPVDGRIGEATPTHAGAFVAEGQTLATIVPGGDLVAVADFSPSVTLGRVRAGQHGRIRLDGFPWGQYGTLPVTVTRVGSEIRDNVVRVEMTLDAASRTMPTQHGLPGTVEVAVEQTSPATLVLRAAGLMLSTPASADALVAEPAR